MPDLMAWWTSATWRAEATAWRRGGGSRKATPEQQLDPFRGVADFLLLDRFPER